MRSHKLQNSNVNKGRFLTPTVNLKLRLTAMNTLAPERLAQRRLDLRLCKELSKETAIDTLKISPQKQESRLPIGARPPHVALPGFDSEFTGPECTLLSLSAAAPCGATGDTGQQAHRVRSRRAPPSADSSCGAGDRRHFVEHTAPSCPLAFRSREDTSNPERLDMDRRGLEQCPLLEGEERLRLLNFQHNLISRLENLSHLRRLVFLDLYDNRVVELSGISALTSLRVLMLGKNRIKRIWNLESLTKLDVLDLHANQIAQIENLSHLAELRVLNLAGNLISRVEGLEGLDSLTELNLRHNRISYVTEVDRLPFLQRLFLSCNCIGSFDELACLGESCSLSELTLDGNPVAQETWYRPAALRCMLQLKQLDMRRVTEEERRMACVLARKDDERKRESHKQAVHKEKRRQAIRNAAQQWEVLKPCLEPPAQNGTKEEVSPEHSPAQANGHPQPLSPEELRRVSPVGTPERPAGSSEGRTRSSSRPGSPRSSEAGGASVQSLSLSDSHLAELDGDTLRLFGLGALEALERGWGVQTAGAVTVITFRYIPFDAIVPTLPRIRVKFPNLSHLVFLEANISRLPQLAALAQVRRLDQLTIHPEGNPAVNLALWRPFVLYRLNHFNLQKINGQEVTMNDVVAAERLFGTLGHIATTETPHCRLLLLLEESRKRQLQFLLEGRGRRAGLSPEELRENGRLLGEGLSRALFNYPSRDANSEGPEEGSVEASERAEVTQQYLRGLVQRASDTNVKGESLHKLWPSMFVEMVRDCVLEMRDQPAYRQACLNRHARGK
ncbi:leucine-rich repeat-containing protein 49-like isoform X1 [Conger conger]|uniref:leucine-rich repeat-containing protein 49-like isoform X1 n=2 Tax=Conger conger TaxID=82655 RepID=UPI002A5AF2B2|nr:leucine-rich repeat-containing protein 49-like isoform X1 [Conger conger]